MTPGEKCTVSRCPIWIKSEYALQPNLDIIGNVPSNTSILILQGENETQTPVEQAFLLQQKLTDVGHPDHTLITISKPWSYILSFLPVVDWSRPNTAVCFSRYLFMA